MQKKLNDYALILIRNMDINLLLWLDIMLKMFWNLTFEFLVEVPKLVGSIG